MGNALSNEGVEGGRNVGRQQAVTEGKARRRGLPPNSVRSTSEDWPFIEVGTARTQFGCRTLPRCCARSPAAWCRTGVTVALPTLSSQC